MLYERAVIATPVEDDWGNTGDSSLKRIDEFLKGIVRTTAGHFKPSG
jgi:hypothetical protein